MEAVYCDKCKKMFPREDTEQIAIEDLYSSPNPVRLDLCSKCLEKFKAFIQL